MYSSPSGGGGGGGGGLGADLNKSDDCNNGTICSSDIIRADICFTFLRLGAGMGEGRDSTEGWSTFLGGRGGGGAPGGGGPVGGAFHLGGRGRAEAPRGIIMSDRRSGAPGGGGDRPPNALRRDRP